MSSKDRDNQFGQHLVSPYARYQQNRLKGGGGKKSPDEVGYDISKPKLSDCTAFFSEPWAWLLHGLLAACIWYQNQHISGSPTDYTWLHKAGEHFDIKNLKMWYALIAHQSVSQVASNFFIIYLIVWRFGHLMSVLELAGLGLIGAFSGVALQTYMSVGIAFSFSGVGAIFAAYATFLMLAQLRAGSGKVAGDFFLWTMIFAKILFESGILGPFRIIETDPMLLYNMLGGVAAGVVFFVGLGSSLGSRN